MPPTPTYTNGHAQVIQDQDDTESHHSTPIFRPSLTRRTPSFSSSSPSSHSWDSSSGSSLSFKEDFSYAFSPNTPLKFSGIPFSWEQLPGIPKRQSSKKKESSTSLLPLPPAGNSKHMQEEISPKKHAGGSFRKDPFYVALVECSKDDQDSSLWKGSKITRTLSDRFGLINMYTSCKRTCAVSESLVYLPRSTPHYLLNRRSR